MKLMLVALLGVTLVGASVHFSGSDALAGPDLGSLFATPSPTPVASVAATPAASAAPTDAPTDGPTGAPTGTRRTPAPTTRTPAPTPVPQCSTRCTLNGRVTGSNGQIVAKASVTAYRAADNSFYGTTVTDANGFFGFVVPAGTYKLFTNPPYTNMTPEWYNDKTTITTANAITVTGTTTIYVVLTVR